MKGAKLTADQVAAFRRNRPAVRASLACEGIYLTAEEEALFEEMDRGRLSLEDCDARILRYCREKGDVPLTDNG